MATEVAVSIQVRGANEATSELRKVAAEGKKSAAELETFGQRTRQSVIRSLQPLGDLARNLSAITALLSVVTRGNKAMQERFEKLTVALSLASTGISVFRTAILTLGTASAGPIGLAVAGVVALALAAEQLQKRFGDLPSLRLDERVIHALGRQTAAERAAAEALDKAAASAARFTSQGQGLIDRQRELASQNEDTTKATIKAADAIDTMGKKAQQAAEEGIRKAREELQQLQDLLAELAAEDTARELEQVTVPALEEMARSLGGVILDARDAPKVFRDMTQADVDLATSLEDVTAEGYATAASLEGVVLEARDVKNAGEQAQAVLDEVAKEILPPLEFGLESTAAAGLNLADVFRTTVKNSANTVEGAFASLFSSVVKGTDAFSQLVSGILGELGRLAGSFVFRWLLGFLFPVPIIPGPAPWIASFPMMQHGGELIVNRPTPLMVGERGAERVSVQPLAGGMAGNGGGGATIIFQGPTFMDEIAEYRLMRKLGRR